MPSALVPPHPGLWAHPPFILLASEWRPPWGLLAWAPFSFIGFSVRKCSPAMTMMIWFTWASTASLVLLEFGQPCCLDWIPPSPPPPALPLQGEQATRGSTHPTPCLLTCDLRKPPPRSRLGTDTHPPTAVIWLSAGAHLWGFQEFCYSR